MNVTGFDEYPFHQHPAPFGTVATSDAHYNDGYFLAFYAPNWYFFSGLRLHPNVNVIDGWGSVTHNDEQAAIRLSSGLHPKPDALSVGPLTYEIIEPLKQIRVCLLTNESGIEFDVTLESQAVPFVEERYQHFKYGAVINDLIRYTQVCKAYGKAKFDGQAIEINNWHAMRDHSWGVRSSMAVPTGINGTSESLTPEKHRALRMWVPFQVGNHVGFFNTHEDADGKTIDFEGRLDFEDGTSVNLVNVGHKLEYITGTARPKGGLLVLDGEDGISRHYTLSLAGTPADVQAGGYYRGWRNNLGPGVYRGESYYEIDRYASLPNNKKSGPPHVPERHRLGPTEFPMMLNGPDGTQGMAHFEHTITGSYKPYGFK